MRTRIVLTILALAIAIALILLVFFLQPESCGFIDAEPSSIVLTQSDVGDSYVLEDEWEMLPGHPPYAELWEKGYGRTYNLTSNSSMTIGSSIYWFNSTSRAKEDYADKLDWVANNPDMTYEKSDLGDEAAIVVETEDGNFLRRGLMFREENVIAVISLTGPPSFAGEDYLLELGAIVHGKLC